MKIAVLADIHSNSYALNTCLEECEREQVDGYIFLGDCISDCPQPHQTLEALRDVSRRFPCWFIRGNREDYQIEHAEGKSPYWCQSSSSGSLLYTYDHLTIEDLVWIRSWPICDQIQIGDMPTFTICHGSPNSTKELLHWNSEQALKALQTIEDSLLICGHTHNQGEMLWEQHCLANPGSVGMPENQDGSGEYMILYGDNGEWKREYRSFTYDIKTCIEMYQKSDLMEYSFYFPYVVMEQIRTGYNALKAVTERIKELTKEEMNQVEPWEIPERYWQQACEEIIKIGVER